MPSPIPKPALENYNRLIDLFSAMERKGKTTPYTSVNGHMTSFLAKDGVMGLRLSPEDRKSFMTEHDSKLMEQHGRVMKEFVSVPGELLVNTDQLSIYMRQSWDYVVGLKPKTTKR